MKRILYVFIITLSILLIYGMTLNIVQASQGYNEDIVYENNADGTVRVSANLKYMTTLTIPESINGKKVTIIDASGFENCKELETVNLPNTIEIIGESAFAGCTKLKNIKLPSKLKEIGDYAFVQTGITEIEISSNVTYVGTGSFANCEMLGKVIFNANDGWIGIDTFYGCKSLKTVEFSENSPVTNISSRTFKGCTALREIILPKKLENIDYEAFEDCESLEKIIIPETVKFIGYSAFSNCSKLKTITSLGKIEEIENRTFENCESLEKIIIPETVKSIDYSAFSNCSRLKTVSIPYSVKSIELYAFQGCELLEKIYITKGTNFIGDYVFGFDIEENYPKNVIICGFKSSAAEQYANEYNIKFEALTPVESISITGDKEVKETDTIKLKSKVLPDNAFYKDVKWETSDKDIATVDENGVVTGIQAGKATILAVSKDGTNIIARYEITVNKLFNFTDVHKGDYFYDAVVNTYKNNIIAGKSDTKFAPYDNITRGQLVTILYRMEGSPKIGNKNPFTDVKNSAGIFYYEGVIWASEKGIVSGYGNGKFGPNDNITRAQLATILWNYAQYKKINVKNVADISKYPDYKKVKSETPYAVEALSWAVGNNVMSGTADGNLSSTETANRAQAATMINNYCIYVKK